MKRRSQELRTTQLRRIKKAETLAELHSAFKYWEYKTYAPAPGYGKYVSGKQTANDQKQENQRVDNPWFDQQSETLAHRKLRLSGVGMTLLGLRNPLRVEQPAVKKKEKKTFLTPGELRKLNGKKKKATRKASVAPTPKRGVAKERQKEQKPDLSRNSKAAKVIAQLKQDKEGKTVEVQLPEKKSPSFLAQFKKEQKAAWNAIVSQRTKTRRQTVFSNMISKCLQQLNGFSNLVVEGGVQ